MHRPNRSTPTPGGSPMPHLQRGPTRTLSIGGHSTTPSYPDLCSVPSRLLVRDSWADTPSPTGSGMDKQMLPTPVPIWKQAHNPARRGTMKRATLAVLAFVATTVVSTTTVSAINTHAYSGAYCKAR
jgi:hypothetical protein